MQVADSHAGRDFNINDSRQYLIRRTQHISVYAGGVDDQWQREVGGHETIEDLRDKLLLGGKRPEHPVELTVKGTLFTCALLSSGWWERQSKAKLKRVKWRDPLQEWLFYGFDEWGPSWDFTFDLNNWERSRRKPFFIAQLGARDEADSLPVLIPQHKAQRLVEYLDQQKWSGFEASITGTLGRREHFRKLFDIAALDLFGGMLDYCLWIDPDNPRHNIERLSQDTSVYSGYLWKCVAPRASVQDGKPSLNDVYFIWEHTNFASPEAVAYNLEAINNKEEYLRQRHGPLVLVQKSSSLVPGTPAWAPDEIYSILLGKTGVVF